LLHKMIVGTGVDLIEVERIQLSMDRHGSRFLDRIYTPAEKTYCLGKKQSAESFAARFAAKEAGAKALGTGISRGVSWLEIEVVRAPGGRPGLRFHGRAAHFAARLGATNVSLSLTHSKTQAMASVILESGPGPAGSGIL
jgi:holo-[acyl-carrier protein] synthase